MPVGIASYWEIKPGMQGSPFLSQTDFALGAGLDILQKCWCPDKGDRIIFVIHYLHLIFCFLTLSLVSQQHSICIFSFTYILTFLSNPDSPTPEAVGVDLHCWFLFKLSSCKIPPWALEILRNSAFSLLDQIFLHFPQNIFQKMKMFL